MIIFVEIYQSNPTTLTHHARIIILFKIHISQVIYIRLVNRSHNFIAGLFTGLTAFVLTLVVTHKSQLNLSGSLNFHSLVETSTETVGPSSDACSPLSRTRTALGTWFFHSHATCSLLTPVSVTLYRCMQTYQQFISLLYYFTCASIFQIFDFHASRYLLVFPSNESKLWCFGK